MKPLPRNQRGIALIIVLASLVLLTLLVVAFLSNVGTELKSSKVYANGSSVKLLAESAVNLVQSEINDATHDGTLCWASQPGMIRTFDNTGNAKQYFKLYSDSAMVGTGGFSPTSTANAVPASWYNLSGIYTDLNEPVTVNSTRRYPIVDGDGNDLIQATSSTVDVTAGIPDNAYFLGPVTTVSSKKLPQVSGFYVTGAPLPATTVNQAPMPVKWLYVLKDGSVILPDAALTNGATTFTNSGTTPDSSLKQIVGRIAFWTDDESSKVNINTASEGAYVDNSGNFHSAVWDTPRFIAGYGSGSTAIAGDKTSLSTCQPVQDEFQRYPGHPATVSLSAVFGNMVTDAANPSGLTYPENVFPLTPRLTQGGSKHGTVVVTALTSPLGQRTDRLYDSVDEFIFQQNRSLNSSLLAGTSSLDQAKIEKSKFFITASSHAPDVNLFNQPRISMWPVSSVGTMLPNRSPKDQLIAFCTTVNGFPYYFQRQDPNDPSTDLPTTSSISGLGRNRQLLEYLRNAVNLQVPGFGGSLAAKYNSSETISGSGIPNTTKEIDQILTEVFDYIRSTNLKDQSIATSATNPVTTYTSTLVTRPAAYAGHVLAGGTGQVVPIVDQTYGTRGFGRFPTIQQAGLIFYASKDNGATVPLATQMRALFVLQLFDPAQGLPWNLPCYRIQVTGLTGFTWDGTTKMFASDPGILANGDSSGWNLSSLVGGMQGWQRFCYGALSPDETTPANYVNYTSLFSSAYPPVPPNPANASYLVAAPAGPGLTGIHFTGGPVTIKFYKNLPGSTGGTVDTNTLIQSITLMIPSAPTTGFPLPAISTAPVPTTGSGATLANHAVAWENWSKRWASGSDNSGFGEILSNNDVIRTVLATPGDMRLIAARKTIDDTANSTAANQFFQVHPRWSVAGENMAHDLTTSDGQTDFHGSMTLAKTGGMLVKLTGNYYDGYSSSGYFTAYGLNFGQEYQGMGTNPFWADIPSNIGVFTGGSGTVLGDWDNGLPALKDGAYINKPDEGDIYMATGYYPYYNNSYGSHDVGQTFFSPNRMIPSSGMMGSLPTGVLGNKPWQTLLFRPGPAGHPGLGTSSTGAGDNGPPYRTAASTTTAIQGPPDHLLMDLFTMPVVEPYAISEPLATAGRINMNYQIVPFTYITRNTGIQAALRGVQVISVPDADATIYKYGSYYSTAPTSSSPFRLGVDIPKTLTQFDARFSKNDVFRSPTEICGIDLVPSNYTGANPPTRASMDTYWNTHRLTGDNSRERPYTNLYPLLTTKSNTFTIHFRVQTLKQALPPGASASAWQVWREGTDTISGEYRGSQTIERYVDANNAVDASGNSLPNFADPANYGKTLAPFYKFRIIATRQFAP